MMETLKNLDVTNVSLLCFLEYLYEMIDNVTEGISIDKFEELLNKFQHHDTQLKIEKHKQQIKVVSSLAIGNFFNQQPEEIKQRLELMDAIVDSRPKRPKKGPMKKCPTIDQETLTAMVEKELNKNVMKKIPENKTRKKVAFGTDIVINEI